jgi:hypothetical protein
MPTAFSVDRQVRALFVIPSELSSGEAITVLHMVKELDRNGGGCIGRSSGLARSCPGGLACRRHPQVFLGTRKLGGLSIRSVGHVARLQRIQDNDAEFVEPSDMLAQLREDNHSLAARLREAYHVCEEHRDIDTTSLIRDPQSEADAAAVPRLGDR